MAGFFKQGNFVGQPGSAAIRTELGFQPDYVWIRGDSGIGAVLAYIPGVTTSYCALGDQNGLWVANDGTNGITVDSTGFTTQAGLAVNGTRYYYFAWRSVPLVCQRLNWTGDGAAGKLIPHTIGAQPQMVFNQPAFAGSGTGGTLYSQPWVQGSLGYVNIQDFGIAGNNKFSTSLNSQLYNSVRVSPTDFSIGAFNNGTAVLYYAYLWANAAGLCKVGTYTGNGAANGTAIDLGFAPKAIILNACDAVANGTLPTVFGDSLASGVSPWKKSFLIPGSNVFDDANGIVISGNTMAPPLSYNATGVVYSYMAFSEADTGGDGSGGSIRGTGWSGVTRLWPSFARVATQTGVGSNNIPGVVAP